MHPHGNFASRMQFFLKKCLSNDGVSIALTWFCTSFFGFLKTMRPILFGDVWVCRWCSLRLLDFHFLIPNCLSPGVDFQISILLFFFHCWGPQFPMSVGIAGPQFTDISCTRARASTYSLRYFDMCIVVQYMFAYMFLHLHTHAHTHVHLLAFGTHMHATWTYVNRTTQTMCNLTWLYVIMSKTLCIFTYLHVCMLHYVYRYPWYIRKDHCDPQCDWYISLTLYMFSLVHLLIVLHVHTAKKPHSR